ncbi:nickel/cobalt transporter regulator [Pseudomonas duriflava]|uniref:Nickel/cobalt transporter regulator n=1 Tax=Pseudomonas duriflava TaxID=459528 RepID=A0A562QLB9_9PSED|nr:anti-virulence regulator CigR family protein [Pseudomonas duriflava]TWI57547.1 nickel/cobalt transporter regulator [Pseudomonas duriflava]
MNMMKKVIASLCITACAGAPLALAAPPDQERGPQGGKGQAHATPQNGHNQGPKAQPSGHQNHAQPNGKPNHGNQPVVAKGNVKHQPPRDFGPVRETIRAHRGEIGRGAPLPHGLVIAKGKPLPRGYGKPLPPGVVKQLPRYEGYEWRRLGTDMVLIAVTTGIVYEILHNVLD